MAKRRVRFRAAGDIAVPESNRFPAILAISRKSRGTAPLTKRTESSSQVRLAPQPKPPRKPRLRTVRHPSETEEFLPSIYKGPEAVKTISRRDLHSASDHRPKSLIFRRLAPLSTCVFPPKERS